MNKRYINNKIQKPKKKQQQQTKTKEKMKQNYFNKHNIEGNISVK